MVYDSSHNKIVYDASDPDSNAGCAHRPARPPRSADTLATCRPRQSLHAWLIAAGGGGLLPGSYVTFVERMLEEAEALGVR